MHICVSCRPPGVFASCFARAPQTCGHARKCTHYTCIHICTDVCALCETLARCVYCTVTYYRARDQCCNMPRRAKPSSQSVHAHSLIMRCEACATYMHVGFLSVGHAHTMRVDDTELFDNENKLKPRRWQWWWWCWCAMTTTKHKHSSESLWLFCHCV